MPGRHRVSYAHQSGRHEWRPYRGWEISVGGAFMRPWRVYAPLASSRFARDQPGRHEWRPYRGWDIRRGRIYAPLACLCAPGIITFRTRINPGAMNGTPTGDGISVGGAFMRPWRVYAPLAAMDYAPICYCSRNLRSAANSADIWCDSSGRSARSASACGSVSVCPRISSTLSRNFAGCAVPRNNPYSPSCS